MNTSRLLVSFAMLLIVGAALASSASAFATIDRVTVNGIEMFDDGDGTAAVFAGETFPVRVIFVADDNQSDVRVVVRLAGGAGFSEVTERFDVLEGNTYSRLLNVQLPYDIDPSEDLSLLISIESDNGGVGASESISLEVQRSSYDLEILSAFGAEQVQAGSTLALDVVLKNRGRQFAEDTYVRARIPELGVTSTVYFGDLSDEDRGGDEPDKEDAVERRMYLAIPRTAPAGLYTVELEAYNSDASVVAAKRILVTSATGDSSVYAPTMSKTFAPGETARYTITLVNAGTSIAVYQLSADAPEGLSVDVTESVVAVPAGSTKTVIVEASAAKAGSYDFAVNVYSSNELVQRANYVANVNGTGWNADPAVILTVILAIIFIVLVIVLIVLLTRKPTKKEGFGESYY